MKKGCLKKSPNGSTKFKALKSLFKKHINLQGFNLSVMITFLMSSDALFLLVFYHSVIFELIFNHIYNIEMLNSVRRLFKKRVMRVRVEGPIDIKKYEFIHTVKLRFLNSLIVFRKERSTP